MKQFAVLLVLVAMAGCSSGVTIKDTVVGRGPGAKDGDTLYVAYTGKLQNGMVFDSNDKPGGKQFGFVLGMGQVIKGWDQGLQGIKEGGERDLVIPPDLAYGDQANALIPPNSTLLFHVKAINVIPAKK